MKKYDCSMKKYDFFRPPPRSGEKKKQDFCKNAQWRAKKLRERGSNTARPTKKGGGGLPIRSRSVDFGASILSRPVDSVDFGASISSCRVARSQPSTRRVVPIRSCRVVPTPCRHPADTLPTPCRHRRQDTKKPDSLNRGIGPQLSQGVARSQPSASSSFKYSCKRSRRSVRSCASILHRDANV